MASCRHRQGSGGSTNKMRTFLLQSRHSLVEYLETGGKNSMHHPNHSSKQIGANPRHLRPRPQKKVTEKSIAHLFQNQSPPPTPLTPTPLHQPPSQKRVRNLRPLSAHPCAPHFHQPA